MSILVGYVPTQGGEAALRAAIAEAKLRNQELLIVNSVSEGTLVDKSVASPEDIARVKQTVADTGIKARILESVYRNDLAEEILDLAKKHDVSLIVIGLRQRTQIGRFIMGSHSQRILLRAEHPVLAVKAGRAHE